MEKFIYEQRLEVCLGEPCGWVSGKYAFKGKEEQMQRPCSSNMPGMFRD